MRVVFESIVAATGVNRERVRKYVVLGELLRELTCECHLIFGAQVARQGEVRADVESPIRALIEVCRIAGSRSPPAYSPSRVTYSYDALAHAPLAREPERTEKW
jgi:hypothetical protein